MNSRGERINAEMQRAVQNIIGTLKDPRITGIISVQRAEVTNDLKHAKILLSIFASSDEAKKLTFEGINSGKNFIRRQLMSEIDLRIMPELHFAIDDSLENSIRINEILNDLNKDNNK